MFLATGRLRYIIMVMVDFLLVNLSFWLAFKTRFDWDALPEHALHGYKTLFLWVAIGRLLIFWGAGLYRWSFRYASFSEALRILRAVALGTFLLMIFVFLGDFRQFVGRSIPLIEFLITSFFILSFRFFFRVNLYMKAGGSKKPRILIVGAGSTGAMVAGELLQARERIYQPVGFVDDEPRKQMLRIHGLKVLGRSEDLPLIIEQYRIDEILIALPNAQGKVVRDIIQSCRKCRVKFKIVPGIKSLLTNESNDKALRDVKPEDLLGREAVKINDSEVRAYLENKVVLISGAGGSIGSELVRQVAGYNPELLLLLDHNENDVYFLELDLKKKFPHSRFFTIIGNVNDIGLLKHTFSKYKPQVVFHAAAHKHVPLMEYNPSAAVKNNIIGTRNLIYAAEHYLVERFVMISTDKAVNPTSVMGASKRITEMLCQAKAKTSKTKFMAVRFGNVIGSNGSVVQLFKKQIDEGTDLTVTHKDIKRYFMTVGEAVQLVLQAGALGSGGEIFILDMGEQIRVTELATNLIALSGLELGKDINIQYTGLRPGEKLYEEMLHNKEHDLATQHDKIFIAQPDEFDLNQLKGDIQELKRLSHQMKHEEVVDKIKQMVPTYKQPDH